MAQTGPVNVPRLLGEMGTLAKSAERLVGAMPEDTGACMSIIAERLPGSLIQALASSIGILPMISPTLLRCAQDATRSQMRMTILGNEDLRT